jgi:histidinol-phosphate/aromatic aminotransferase/cobyric acid decarboxylase-like protein
VNLNPKDCPERVKEALSEAAGHVGEYPDSEERLFRQKVALAENKLAGGDYISAANVLGGNGASELIMAVTRLVSPRKVLMAVPSFYGYLHAVRALGETKICEYVLDSGRDFAIGDDFPDLIREDTDLVILGNPNNPTGRCIDEKLLNKIIQRCSHCDCALVVDECFLHLSRGAVSSIRYLNSCRKLFVINAYTKLFSIPGVRVGYVISSTENIGKLRALLPEWNMSVFAQKAGEACADVILETDYAGISRNMVESMKSRMERDFAGLGFEVFHSDTCFILVRSDKRLYDFFLERGILIRDCSNFAGLANGYYRFAVKDEESYEMLKECFDFLT